MNLAIALTATREGAKIANHVEVLSLIKEKEIVKGAHVRDTLTGKEWNVFAKVIVNATGEPLVPEPCKVVINNVAKRMSVMQIYCTDLLTRAITRNAGKAIRSILFGAHLI